MQGCRQCCLRAGGTAGIRSCSGRLPPACEMVGK
nr:MAG TPA: hypothetical protein [Caudoviricetes sp.]DAO37607.1 MAG TPA: hypothetical protein [Herelleviridae sp.]